MIPPLKLDHLYNMTDEFGIFQFATHTIPNKKFGYTLDDNARALIACLWLLKEKDTKALRSHITIYFNFIKKCLLADEIFVNYIGYDKHPTKQNADENLEDVYGRALWALAELMNSDMISSALFDDAKILFLKGLKNCSQLTHLKSMAFAIKACALGIAVLPEYKNKLEGYINTYADFLLSSLEHNSHPNWAWFEEHITYNVGLLPESLLIAGAIIRKQEYTDKGILSLTFLIQTTFSEDMYHPIGNSHWYKQNSKRSYYDQQPEDPSSMILSLVRAYNHTQNSEYKKRAMTCFGWFLGINSLGISLYDEKSGGCQDGLLPHSVNLNQGAESLISYLMARTAIKKLNE